MADIAPLWQVAQEHFEAVYGKSEAAALREALLKLAFDDRLPLPSLR